MMRYVKIAVMTSGNLFTQGYSATTIWLNKGPSELRSTLWRETEDKYNTRITTNSIIA